RPHLTLSRRSGVDTIRLRMAISRAHAFAALLDAFAGHLRAERHASPHTLRTLDGRLDRSSIGRKLAAVRGFFRFLVATKQLRRDPTVGIGTPKTRRKLPSH